MRTLITGIAAAGLSLLLSGAAQAASINGQLTVQASVSDTCAVNDLTMNFGGVTLSTGTVLPNTSLINVTCSLGTTFSVGLGDGVNASSGQRRMRRGSSTDYLNYDLYKDLTLTTRFGNTGASDRAGGVGLGILPTAVSVYGAIPSGQSVGAGSYSDTVQITVLF